MVNRFQLPVNAQFYKKRKTIAANSIQKIMTAALQNIKAGSVPLLNVGPVIGNTKMGTSYNYYAAVYLTERPVQFFNHPIFDEIYAFILIIEIGDWVSIVKKSVSPISKPVADALDVVSVANLTSSLNDSEFSYQQVAVRTMTISTKEVRAKTYEAENLNGVLSPHMAGRSILSRLKVRKGVKNRTITLNSGRLMEAMNRLSLPDLANWMEDRIKEFAQTNSNNFTSLFAKHVDLEDLPASISLKAIFFDLTQILDELERIGSYLYYERPRGNRVRLSQTQIEILQSRLNRVYEVDPNLDVINHEITFSLQRNKKSISFSNKWLKNIKIDENGKSVSLQTLIRENGYFGVCFSNPEYMYFGGSCFWDSSAISAIDHITSMFDVTPALAHVNSEKGTFSATHVSFDVGSVFQCVEQQFCNSDYLFCDDLGTEWADHIALDLKDACITFIHSKHGHISSSASNLHDVIGQALKNLGNMRFTEKMFIEKWQSKFRKYYTCEKSATKIRRIRIGDGRRLKGDLNSLLSNHKLYRKCILACSFLSKRKIIADLNKVKNGKPVRGHVIQLLWILSAFLHASDDSGVVPVVLCAP